MLPASDLTEIIANLAGLKLEHQTTLAVLGAVLAPLLRADPPAANPHLRVDGFPSAGRRRPRRKKPATAGKPKRQAERAQEARDKARAALQANPDTSLTAIAKVAGVSRGTVVLARRDLAAAARKEARKSAREASKAAQPERRQRAQQFLKNALAGGPQRASDIEERAAKAHVDDQALTAARADLGVLVSRSNTGVQAVTWSLPAP